MSDILRLSQVYQGQQTITPAAIQSAQGAASQYDLLSDKQIGDSFISGGVLAIRDGIELDILKTLSSSPDPEGAISQWQAAKSYADIYGVSPAFAYQNLDAFNKQYFIAPPPLKTLPRAISDSFKAQKLAIEVGELYSEYMGVRGLMDTSGGVGADIEGNVDPRDRAYLLHKIKGIKEEMAKLQLDATPRAWYESWMKSIASAIPYTAEILKTGAIAAGGVALAAATGGALAGQGVSAAIMALKAFISTTASFTKGVHIMRGMEFDQMVSRGIPEEIAFPYATSSAMVGSALEQFIGIEGMIGGALSKGMMGRVTERIVKELHISGILTTAASKFAARSALDVLSEGVEEGSQEIVSGLATIMAQSAAEEGVVFDKITGKQVFENAANAMFQAMVVAPFLGLPGNIVMAISDKKVAADVAALAPGMDKDSFVGIAKESGAFSGPGISPEMQGDLAGQVWEEQAKKKLDEKAQGAAKAKEIAAGGQPGNEAGIERQEDGTVFVKPEHVEGRGEKGQARTRYTAGPASGGEAYGFIDVEEDDTSVTLKRSQVEGKYLGITSDIIASIATHSPGKEIVLGTDADEALVGGYTRFIESIGGQEANKARIKVKESPEDSLARERVKGEVRAMATKGVGAETIAGETLANVTVKFMEIQAKSLGVSFAEYSKRLNFKMLPNRSANLKYSTVYGVTGTRYKTVPSDTSQIVYERRVAKEMAMFVEAQISIATGATNKSYWSPTMAHELMHYYRRFRSSAAHYDANMEAIEKAYGIKKGDRWTVEQEEQFVEDYEQWLRNKKAVSKEKATFFEQMAEFFRTLFNYVGKYPEANPEVTKAFENWFGAADLEQDTSGLENLQSLGDGVKRNVRRHADLETQEERRKAREAARDARSGTSESKAEELKEKYGQTAATLAASIKAEPGSAAMVTKTALMDGSWVYADDLSAIVKEAAGLSPSQEEEAALAVSGEVGAITLTSAVTDDNVEYDKKRKELFKIQAADESWATAELLAYIKRMETALKTHNLTRIHNLFAYDTDIEANDGLPLPVQVSMDADTLKFVNDTLGHEEGDKLLIAIADALFDESTATDMRVYHKSGDEFIAQGNDREAIETAIRTAIEKVSTKILSGKIANKPGFMYTLSGIGISAGFDSEGDLAMADLLMQEDKKAREANGKRTRRGDLPAGLSVIEEGTGRKLSDSEARVLLGLEERRVQGVQGSLEEGTGEDAGLLGIVTLSNETNTVPGPDETTERSKYDRKVEGQARKYNKLEDWLKDIFGDDWETRLAEADVKWYSQRFDWAHSDKSVKRKYRNAGDFHKFLSTGQNLSKFIQKIASIVYSKRRYLNEDTTKHAARIEGAIARTPEIKELVDAFNKNKTEPSQEQKKALLELVRKYEGLYKYLFATVEADQDLANEALDDLDMIPELFKRDITGDPLRSLSDNQDLIDSLEGEEIIEKIREKTITIEDIEKLLKDQEDKWKAALEAVKTAEGYTDPDEKSTAAKIRAAVDEARKQERSYFRALERLKKYREEVRRMQEFILRRPSARVDLHFAMMIQLIQQYASSDRPIDINELRAASSFIFAKNDPRIARIEKLIDGISGKAMKYWSLSQLETLASIVEDLTIAGRNTLRNEELIFGEGVRDSRNKILDELRTSKYWAKMGDQYAFASEDDKDNQKRLAKMSTFFDADRPDAFFRKYLGKEAAKVLFDGLVSATNAKLENYDRRTKPVLDFLASSGLGKQRRLFEQLVIEGVGPEGTDLRITKSELIGIRLLIGTREEFNASQREAFIYGNLFSGDEKNVDGGLTDENQFSTNAMMKAAYLEKLEKLLAATEKLSADEETLAKLMMATTDNDRDWQRFATTIYRLTNTEPKKEKFYFPILRVGDFSDGEDGTNDALKGLDMTWAIPKGMSIERRAMQPRNHKEIQYDSMRVFFSAIQRQEHLTEMGMYVKTLRGIFRSSTMSETIRKGIVNSLGKKAWDYIDNQITTITNPAEFTDPASGAEALNLFRGSMVISNLAWRASSVLMQAITSPLPFLSEAPAQLYAVAAEAMVKNPFKFYKEIEEKSAYLRHRQITPEMDILQQRTEQGVATAFEKLGRAGMVGLSMADRISVAIGWEAVRRKKRAEGMSESDAREYADRVVIKTQPTSEEQYRSPMYRNMTPFKQLVLQFTQPLNVIWNNLRNDIPTAAKDQEYGKIVGFITAYAISGLAIGAIACVRGNGPDEPDEEKWVRFWLHAMTAQFTDSIPLVGNIVTGLTGTLIVGDNNSWMRNDTNMPAVDLLARAVEGFASDNKNWGKIVTNTAMGMGMMVGAPTRAVKEMVDLITKGVGAAE